MLPGRTFAPEEILGILRRRIWIILVPFAVISAATAIYARRLPDVYRAEALIGVQPPKVPENLVRTGLGTPKVEDRIPEIRTKILSRSRLERIIQDLNLYPDERRSGVIMQDIVEKMQRSIRVDPHSGSAIRVSFEDSNARTVHRVAEQLAALLMDESTRNRRTLIEGTNQFLDTSLSDTQRRLEEKETALAKYRREHDGELPDQMNANLQAAQNQQMQIQALVSQRNGFEERRLHLEKTIQELESQALNEVPELQPGQTGTTAQQLNAARQRLADLELTRTPAHPEVQQVRRVIQELETKLEREATESPVGSRTVSPAEAARLKRLQENRDLLAQLDRQMKALETELGNARQRAQEFLRRADAAPMRQTDMTSLTRDYAAISTVYSNLLASKEQSAIAANLERREIGESFELIDPARQPTRPSSPNRNRLNLIGMTIGLAFGVGLVALLEYRDSAFKTDEDLARVLGMPVLAVVPLMQSDQERRRTFQRRIAVGTVLGGTVFMCLAVVAYTFVR